MLKKGSWTNPIGKGLINFEMPKYLNVIDFKLFIYENQTNKEKIPKNKRENLISLPTIQTD